jgi:hypothetical protein
METALCGLCMMKKKKKKNKIDELAKEKEAELDGEHNEVLPH